MYFDLLYYLLAVVCLQSNEVNREMRRRVSSIRISVIQKAAHHDVADPPADRRATKPRHRLRFSDEPQV